MDPNNFPFDKQPRKELLGPRPTPLKVRKDSHKIKKPPLPPTSQQSYQQNQSEQQSHQSYRPPVIIYTVSPKVIHTKPSEFMTLVQRLTGASASSPSSTSISTTYTNNNYNNVSGYAASTIMSSAARYATLENASKAPKGEKFQVNGGDHYEIDQMGGSESNNNDIHGGMVFERRSNLFPGILSPGPSSLQPIQPNLFFSPPPPSSTSDADTISSFFHDLSPVQHGNRTYMEGSFMNSPSNFLSPYMNSPTQNLDIFNYFLD